MENEVLKFSYNWNNKLNCLCFSTIRIRNDRKYYVGAKKIIQLKGEQKGVVTIVSVSYFTIDKLTEAVSRLDTGYSIDKCRDIIKTMYKNSNLNWDKQQFVFCVLAYDEKNKI